MMNMEEQFQRFIDSNSGPSDPFVSRVAATVPRPPPPIHIRHPLPSTALTISHQVYKYVKWITVVIIVGVILYFLHSLSKQYLFPQTAKGFLPAAAAAAGVREECPVHPGVQPPLPTVDLPKEYENNNFLEEEETMEPPPASTAAAAVPEEKPEEEPVKKDAPPPRDDKFTPLSDLVDA